MKIKDFNRVVVLVIIMLFGSGCAAADTKPVRSNENSLINETSPPSPHPAIESKDELYQKAINFIAERNYPQAMGILTNLGEHKEAQDLLAQMRYIMDASYISNGHWAVGAITAEHGVQVAIDADTYGFFAGAEDWRDIRAISLRGGESLEGLTSQGSIITTSTYSAEQLKASPVISTGAMAKVVDTVTNWRNIQSFQSFYPQSAVALDKNGIVYVANSFLEQNMTKNWNNVVSVADGRSYVLGLKSDGTVAYENIDYAGTIDTSAWRDIVAISADLSVIGLKEDGTVISTGLNRFGEGKVSDWTDIIAISTCSGCTLGLKSDGTVVAAGQNTYGQMNVEDWTDIVAVAAGSYFSVGLKSDGTMVLAGDCSDSGAKTPDVSGMKDLYIPEVTIIK